MDLHFKLEHILTQWDIKQSTKRGYNPNALAIYLRQADRIVESVNRGATIAQAIDQHFCDRLAAMLHKKFN